MAKLRNIPTYQQKQKLLYDEKTSEAERVAAAETFQAAGILSEAIELWEKLDRKDQLSTIASQAMQAGDAFLFNKARLALKQPIKDNEWQQLGVTAERLGKLRFAHRAFEACGNEERLRLLDQKIAQQQSQHASSDGESNREESEEEQTQDSRGEDKLPAGAV